MLLASTETKNRRLKKVFVSNAIYDWPFPELSPQLKVSELRFPIELLSDKENNSETKNYCDFVKMNNRSISIEIKACNVMEMEMPGEL
jgi:hypothetical protein